MRGVDWQPYAGGAGGSWWQKGRVVDAERLLTADQAAWWASQHADAKRPRRKRRGRK